MRCKIQDLRIIIITNQKFKIKDSEIFLKLKLRRRYWDIKLKN